MRRQLLALALFCLITTIGWAQPTFQEPPKIEPSQADREKIRKGIEELGKRIDSFPETTSESIRADVEIFHKAAVWIDRHNEYYTAKYPEMTLKLLAHGLARAKLVELNQVDWDDAEGSIVRGYVSKVDGSIQPYAIYVPKSYDGLKRQRLDVILHGRGATLNEVSFLAMHTGKPAPAQGNPLTLHVFGRTNNAYRWAGETDVFEAIEAVKKNYTVDESKIVLQGFSMGGAGAWHLGLHHPSFFRTVEAGAGFSETKNYTKLKDAPATILKALHIYDAIDYAQNAVNVPIVGYGGEDDPQLQASTNIINALAESGTKFKTDGLITTAEGFDFMRVVGAKMGHKVDPPSRKIMDEFHQSRNGKPRATEFDFTTYTLKYPRVAWIKIHGLKNHYEPARIHGKIDGEKAIVKTNENISLLSINREVAETVSLNGEELPVRPAAKGLLPDVYYAKLDDKWAVLDHSASLEVEKNANARKAPGIQGPIDDAFASPFLIVKPTGMSKNPAHEAWSNRRLEHFAGDWDRFMRGTLRAKNDVDVTDDDIAAFHLITFGDPDSNRIIARTANSLPLTWPKDSDLAPALITANPLNPHRYLVINSGHTFGAKEFLGTNALLYPKLGDWAIFEIGKDSERIRETGYFNESWKK